MSKGKNQTASRPVPDTPAGSTTNGPALSRPRTGSVNRLPSLRPKRDLTLGASPSPPSRPPPKKTFTPTIPVRRKKPTVPSPSPSLDEGILNGRERERERRGKERAGRGGKRERDIITSASIFSMGPAEKHMQKREGTRETFGSFSRPQESKNDVIKRERDETRDVSKNNFHFLDEEEGEEMDNVTHLFPNSKLPPVQLPLDYSLHTRHKAVASKPIKNKVKLEASELGDLTAVSPDKQTKAVLGSTSNVEGMTAAQLFTPSEGTKGQFLFFQLPDCIPVGERRGEEAMDTTTAARPQPAATSTAGKEEEGGRGAPVLSSLKDLPEGLIGKIRVHKSGKVKLVLGDNTLDVAMGTPCGFLQELVSVKTDQEGPEMVVLGQLSHRLICTPDFESLLASEKLTGGHEQYR